MRQLQSSISLVCHVSVDGLLLRLVAEVVHEERRKKKRKKGKSLQDRGHLEGFQKLLFLAALSSVTPSRSACSSHQKRVSVLLTCETTSNRRNLVCFSELGA